jgi:hypothetical protein
VIALPLLLAALVVTLLPLAVGPPPKGEVEGLLIALTVLGSLLSMGAFGVQVLRAGFAAPVPALQASGAKPTEAPCAAAPRPGDDAMIRFRCPRCGKALKGPARGAGRSASCPRCGAPAQIPPAG